MFVFSKVTVRETRLDSIIPATSFLLFALITVYSKIAAVLSLFRRGAVTFVI